MGFEVGLDGGGQVGPGIALLLVAGDDHAEQGFHEAAAVLALRAEREFAPDHGVTQTSLGGVVGGFDAVDIEEGPQPFAMVVQLLAHADQSWVAAEDSAQQERVHLIANWCEQLLQFAKRDRSIATARPVTEQDLRLSQQVASQALHLGIRMIDERLEVAFQMCPAPLQAAELPEPVSKRLVTRSVSEGFCESPRRTIPR